MIARLTARSLACVMLLAAACGDLPQVASVDAAFDANSEKCPAQKPNDVACVVAANISCSYPGSVCVCDGTWVCRSDTCPLRQSASGACPRALTCDYGFGDVCTCVSPENVWRCCVGPCAVDGGTID